MFYDKTQLCRSVQYSTAHGCIITDFICLNRKYVSLSQDNRHGAGLRGGDGLPCQPHQPAWELLQDVPRGWADLKLSGAVREGRGEVYSAAGAYSSHSSFLSVCNTVAPRMDTPQEQRTPFWTRACLNTIETTKWRCTHTYTRTSYGL